MMTFAQRLFVFLVVWLLFSIQPSAQDYSISSISAFGLNFVPKDSSYPPVLTFTTNKLLYCYLQCNKRIDCRIFEFDSSLRQCRLWDTDLTTGSIVPSPTKPQSSVGTIRTSLSIYANIYNQSCDECVESRYVTCDANSNTCRCPSKTYWNGSICVSQLLRTQICSQANICRSDLNLTCGPSCEDLTYRCLDTPAMGIGETVVGFCNATVGSGPSDLQGPWGIYVSPLDGTLYLTDWDKKRFQSLSPFSRTAQTIFSGGLIQAMDIFVDSSGLIYMTDDDLYNGIVYVQQAGIILRSFPAVGQSTFSCPLTGLCRAYGIAVDRFGNAYISLYYCSTVVKWAPNATSSTLLAGKTRINNSTSDTLSIPRFIYLDEDRGALYVSDSQNNRIQKFIIGGNGTGVTVAGNITSGIGLNQLKNPGGIWVTRDGQTLYVSDSDNNRIMKWTIGATQGSLFAGSVSGVAGSTAKLFNQPGDVALDPTETYLYVADYGNHRVQRFRVQ